MQRAWTSTFFLQLSNRLTFSVQPNSNNERSYSKPWAMTNWGPSLWYTKEHSQPGTMGEHKFSLQRNVLADYICFSSSATLSNVSGMLSVCTGNKHKLLFWTQHSLGFPRECKGRVEKINVTLPMTLSIVWNAYERR